jgi:uncharacterized SAM-binding protein YcdF (DUF218 family)
MQIAASVLIAAGALYAFSTPALTALGAQLIHADPVERADAMIVLAPLLERVVEAADLYASGYAPIVILTRERRDDAERLLIERGVIDSREEERRRVLIALGVPADAIVILEPFVDSTADEARGFAEWARRRSIQRVIVVTSPIHTARSRLTFMRALEHLPIRIIVRPSSRGRFRSDTWWRSRDTLRDGMLEWQKLLYYRLVELRRLAPVTPVS